MAIIKRTDKGSPLSFSELDGNFDDLNNQISSLKGGDSGNTIASGSFADIQVTPMYGARLNMSVQIGQPLVPTAGIIYQGFVSANDIVTVRASNITGSAIDPASQILKVQVTLI